MTTQCAEPTGLNFTVPARETTVPTIKPLASFVARFFNKVADYLEQRKQQRIDRAAFQAMMDLDENILDDIGVTRQDILWASKLPLCVNSSKALEEMRKYGRN